MTGRKQSSLNGSCECSEATLPKMSEELDPKCGCNPSAGLEGLHRKRSGKLAARRESAERPERRGDSQIGLESRKRLSYHSSAVNVPLEALAGCEAAGVHAPEELSIGNGRLTIVNEK